MNGKEIIDKIVAASKGLTVEYHCVQLNGINLLISKTKLKDLVDITWERTHDPEVAQLADELGVKLRTIR